MRIQVHSHLADETTAKVEHSRFRAWIEDGYVKIPQA